MSLPRVTEKARLRAQAKARKEAEAANEAMMQRIADRCGLTVVQIRALPKEDKDRLIFRWRDR